MAVVLGAGTLGFVVDALASVHGVFSPGTVSALSATGALAAKKGWESRREAKRAEKAAATAIGKVEEARARAEKMAWFFEGQGYAEGVRAMRTQLVRRKERGLTPLDGGPLRLTHAHFVRRCRVGSGYRTGLQAGGHRFDPGALHLQDLGRLVGAVDDWRQIARGGVSRAQALE